MRDTIEMAREAGFDHVESDKDYKLACIICEALNKEEL